MSLPNVYLRNPPTLDSAPAVQDLFPQLAADRETMLVDVEKIALSCASYNSARAQLKDILIRQFSSFPQVDFLIQDRGAILIPILHEERQNIRSGNAADAHTSVIFGSIASTILRMRSAELAEVFLRSDPDVFPEFFAGSSPTDNARILKWFGNFQYDGPPKLGSLALEHFGFAHREWFWDQHFRWFAARAPTPIVAANQRHLMLSLDVPGSLRTMLGKFSHETHRYPPHEDGALFWTSSQWKECVRTEMRQLFAIDTQFWVDRMVRLLTEPDRNAGESISRAYWNLVVDFLNEQPPSIQMRTLFSGLTDAKFFHALKSVTSQLLKARNSDLALRGSHLFSPFLDCLKAFLMESSMDQTCNLLVYASLFDFSSEFVRMLASTDSLSAIRKAYSDYLAKFEPISQQHGLSSSDLDEISHNLLLSRSNHASSPWRWRCLEALLVEIRISDAVGNYQLDQSKAEELFVREGVSCEVVEVTRVKRSKKHKKDKHHGKSDSSSKQKEATQTTEFLGWRLQSRAAKRAKENSNNDDDDLEAGEIQQEQNHEENNNYESSVLHTLSDLHKWFHDAYLRQYLVAANRKQ